MPLTRIDAKLYLNLDHVVLLERDDTGVVVRFVHHATDYIEDPAAQALIDAVERARKPAPLAAAVLAAVLVVGAPSMPLGYGLVLALRGQAMSEERFDTAVEAAWVAFVVLWWWLTRP